MRPARRAPLPQRFEVRCADIHALSCEETLRAERRNDVVALACDHGAVIHGFTTAWYSDKRLAMIARAVTTRLVDPVQPRSAGEAESDAVTRDGGGRR